MTKYCLHCEKELLQKPMENITNFRKRKFCDHRCSVEYYKTKGHWRDYPEKR